MKPKTKLTVQLIILAFALLFVSAILGRMEFVSDRVIKALHILSGLSIVSIAFTSFFVKDSNK
jgi:hypothetical protein